MATRRNGRKPSNRTTRDTPENTSQITDGSYPLKPAHDHENARPVGRDTRPDRHPAYALPPYLNCYILPYKS
jgi:hypothetical protein